MKILVTGFEPFGGQDINPSEEVLKLLPDSLDRQCCGGVVEIVKLSIPTTMRGSMEAIRNAVETHQPDVVLSIGQAGGRADITLEAVGTNEADFPIPDNDGNLPRGEVITEGGPDAYFTSIPNKRVVAGILNKGIPASISRSAGTYVCNYVCYKTCDFLRNEYPHVRSGFMHIPYLPEQVAMLYEKGKTAPQPSMSLDVVAKAVISAIMSIYRCVEHDVDENGDQGEYVTGSTH
ncbi:MAG: pyroglutamyl-peptidase I [Bacillota bacterium]|nr:pyroglutamyl-peptidase I [Bacillota bacterium]